MFVTLSFPHRTHSVAHAWASKKYYKFTPIEHNRITYLGYNENSNSFTSITDKFHIRELISEKSFAQKHFAKFKKKFNTWCKKELGIPKNYKKFVFEYVLVSESHLNGYLHMHLLFKIKDKFTNCFFKYIKYISSNPKTLGEITYRLSSFQKKEEIKKLWGGYNIDVQGIYSPSLKKSENPKPYSVMNYLSKYLSKNISLPLDKLNEDNTPKTTEQLYSELSTNKTSIKHLLTLALTWLFRKRTFSASRDITRLVKNSIVIPISPSHFTTTWEFLGTFILTNTSSNKPPPSIIILKHIPPKKQKITSKKPTFMCNTCGCSMSY